MSRARRRLLLALWAVIGLGLAAACAAQGPRWLDLVVAAGWHLASPPQLWWAALAWLIPAGLLFSLTDLPRPQQVLQAAVRMLLVGVIAIGLAGPRTRQEAPRGVQVIHLVDRSASVPDELLKVAADSILADGELARTAAFTGASDPIVEPLRVDVVVFDGAARRLPWPATGTQDADPLPAPDLQRQADSALATDLEAALNTALGLVQQGRVVHAVIWSDGVETRGDASALADALHDAGVIVHTPAQAPTEPAGEVVVERVQVPAALRSNVPFEVAAIVRATGPATVSCTLRGPNIAPDAVVAELRRGENRVALGKIRLKDGGQHELDVRCKVQKGPDRFAGNNAMRTRVVVLARPRVLYVEGAASQAEYLRRALQDDFEIEVRHASGLPRKLAELKRYDIVILSDVARVSAAGEQQVTVGDMHNLEAYVKAGGGLLVLGGEDSLGSGGYQGTYLDKHVLPVRLEIESEVQQPVIAMVLCIDRSGSMLGTKIELAKEAARATAQALGHDDKIAVLAFANITRAVVRMQRAGNRNRIASDIGRLTAGGGTNIYPCLQQAYDILNTASARIKHVILLSDGEASRAGIDGLVHQMRRSGMTVSAVGLGPDAARDLLDSIADRGGGRAYFADRPESLPSIFVRETMQVTGESVVERKIHARRVAAAGRIDILRGVDLPSSPLLLGYLPTKVKPGATEILRTSTGAPLLVRWQLGLGKCTVWTSDLKNRWAHHWIDWPDYAVFARQLVRDMLSEQLGSRVAVQVSRDRDRLRIAVDAVDEDDRYLTNLRGEAIVRLPDGTERKLALPEIALGRYETSTPLDLIGPYGVSVALGARGKPPLATGAATAVHPYADEYRILAGGTTSLPGLVKRTGGNAEATAQHWRADRGETHQRWQWLWPDLIKLALALLLIDVALRRIRLGRATSRSWYDRR